MPLVTILRSRSVLLGLLLFCLVGTATAQLLDPLTQPQFVRQLPNPLSPGFIFQPTQPGGTHYEIGMYPIEQWLGLIDPVTGEHLMTSLWGYGTGPGFPNATFPGRSFELRRNEVTTIRWTNNLVDETGNPLPHLLPVDESLHWAFALPGYEMNNLLNDGIPVVPHVHGGHTESDSDGLPEYWFTPGFAVKGPRWVKETYRYDNDQDAGTLWYHDHGLGITRLNVYAGLAGFWILRDDFDTGRADNPLGLPAYPYEVPIVIQDRMFTADGQLFYPTTGPELPAGAPDPSALPEFFGDFIVVNGVTWPYLNVEPRSYRLRLLNGSDSRFYDLYLSSAATAEVGALHLPPKITIIGTDDALLYRPVDVDGLVIGPGERYDVIIDFTGSENSSYVLRNRARSPYPKGGTVDPRTTGQIMMFRVGDTAGAPGNPLAETLRDEPIRPSQVGEADRTRKLALFEGQDSHGRLQPMLGVAEPTLNVEGQLVDGSLLWDEMHHPITENPMVDDVEIWEVYNSTADAHPIHLHLVSFQILGRQKFKATAVPKEMPAHDGSTSIGFTLENLRKVGRERPPLPTENGWKDTAIMYPGEVTRVIARFDRPGRYVWHCHILSHEDHEMMRPYHVGPMPAMVAAAEGLELSASPSPFNPSTMLSYSLSTRGLVRVRVYDVRGRLVRTLVDAVQDAGGHELLWNGRDDDGDAVTSGVYLAELKAEGRTFSTKLVLVK